MAFQPHALVVASVARGSCYGESEEQENRRNVAEERQWNADVIDLQRVMSISQALFYLLEHNNEPLLRVAMEMVMDKQTVKSLWWDEGWYSDEDRRERFREMVRQKLALAMNGTGEVAEYKGDSDSVSKAVYDALKARHDKVEGQFNAADRAKIVAEDQVRTLENTQSELKEKLRAVEKAAEEMRNRIRDSENNKEDPSDGKVAELEQQMKSVEQQRNMAQERVKELERQLGEAGKSELLEAQRQLEQLQKQLKETSELAEQMKKEAEKAKDELAKEKGKVKPIAAPKVQPEVRSKHGPRVDQDEFDAMKKQFQDERDRAKLAEKSAQQGQDDLARAQKELEDLRAKYETSEARASHAETRASEAERDADKWKKEAKDANDAYSKAMEEAKRSRTKKQIEVPTPQEEKPRTPMQVQGVPQEEVDKLMAELEKFKERAKKYKAENDELKDANSKLEEKQLKMLKMLHDIKEQLRRVTEIAEKRGLGDVVKQILEESKVSETLESADYTCFNRLYDDAKRRQEKQRKLQAEKFGISADRFHKWTPHQHQMAGQSFGSTSETPSGPHSDFQSYGYSSSQDNLHFTEAARTYPGPNVMTSVGPMSFNGPGQHTWQGGGGSHTGNQPSPQHGRGENMNSTWHPGHSNNGGAASRPLRSTHMDTAAGNLYATGSNFHRGGMQAERVENFRHHPAGALEIPHDSYVRNPFDGFAVTGFNPRFGPPPSPKQLPVSFNNHSSHPLGLAGSASTGTFGAAYPKGASSLSPLGFSAMAIDSSARHRSSSSSPPPPRRRLLESPTHRLGEELPPLAHGALLSSPLARSLASEGALRSAGLPRLHKGMKSPRGSQSQYNLHRSAGRLAGQELEPAWRPPQTKNVDDILGRASNSPDVGITGWALSGHSAEGIAP